MENVGTSIIIALQFGGRLPGGIMGVVGTTYLLLICFSHRMRVYGALNCGIDDVDVDVNVDMKVMASVTTARG